MQLRQFITIRGTSLDQSDEVIRKHASLKRERPNDLSGIVVGGTEFGIGTYVKVNGVGADCHREIAEVLGLQHPNIENQAYTID